MGLGLSVIEKQGPRFERPVRTLADIQKLPIPDPEQELRYVMDAVRLISRELDGKVPLIGFAGSPWTIGTYMIEGASSKEYTLAKGMMYTSPATMHLLLSKLTESITAYLNAQIAAGVNVVMLFDSWGGVLSDACYREFSLEYMQRIVAGIKPGPAGNKIPIILFTKGGGLWLEQIARSGCDAIGVDWTVNIGEARKRTGNKVAIQGNLDTAVLYSNPDVIRQEVGKVLDSYGHGSGHIFNLGHGIHPEIKPENVAALVDAVHELSKKYH
jgi:uroporphyrinogen decarboxylase